MRAVAQTRITMYDAFDAHSRREIAEENAAVEARIITSYLTDAQAEQIADEIRAKAEESEAAERAAAEDRAALIDLRNYTQVLELRYAEALNELQAMTERRDGLANLIAHAYSNRWSNPGEYGAQRLLADTIAPARRAA